ncbi:unnamed protein product [Lota lota]
MGLTSHNLSLLHVPPPSQSQAAHPETVMRHGGGPMGAPAPQDSVCVDWRYSKDKQGFVQLCHVSGGSGTGTPVGPLPVPIPHPAHREQRGAWRSSGEQSVPAAAVCEPLGWLARDKPGTWSDSSSAVAGVELEDKQGVR